MGINIIKRNILGASITPDELTFGGSFKRSVEMASTQDSDLSGEETMDGTLTSTSRVLLKNQTDASENGIYVTAGGAWTRATDNDENDKMTSGFMVVAQKGTVNALKIFMLTTNEPIVLDTDNLTFTELGGKVGANALASGSVGTSQLGSAVVTEAKLGLLAVVEAILANNSVSKAKLKTGSKGEVLAYDSQGEPVGVPIGSSAQVLTFVAEVKATGTVTCVSVLAADTVTVNGLTYTAVSGAKANDTEFDMAGTDDQCAADLADSIDDDGRQGSDETLVDQVGTDSTNVATITSSIFGAIANNVNLSSSNGSRLAVSAATLTGGVDATPKFA